MSAKLCKMFPTFCKIFLKQFLWTLDVETFRTVMLNIAKAHVLFVKKETFDVFLRSKNVWND